MRCPRRVHALASFRGAGLAAAIVILYWLDQALFINQRTRHSSCDAARMTRTSMKEVLLLNYRWPVPFDKEIQYLIWVSMIVELLASNSKNCSILAYWAFSPGPFILNLEPTSGSI